MRALLNRRRAMLTNLDKSPYSKAATTTLKADFPDYWEDIKAYGYANSEMVPYINEDPYVIISLGLVNGVIRYLVGNASAYINTNYIPNNKTDFETSQIFRAVSNNMYWGTRDINTGGNGFAMFIVNNSFRFDNGHVNNLGTAQKDILYKTIKNGNTITINQTLYNISAFSTTINTPLVIMGSNSAGSYCGKLVDCLYFKIIEEGTVLYNFIPFTHNNSNGMINILTGTFYPNANSVGEFTIEYSGLPFLNISSTTKNSIITAYGQDAWTVVKNFFTDPATESLVASVNSDYTVVEELCGINGGGLEV